MSNGTYLIASYFLVGVLCLGIALVAYLWLRRPMGGVADSLPQKSWRKVIRSGFPLSTILLALSWCLSVNYYGCEQKKYNEILNDRSYIARKNAEQLSEAMQGIIWSVSLWSVVLAVALRAARRGSAQ